MMNTKIASIALYGNLILDSVYVVDRFPVENESNLAMRSYKVVGAIGNVLRHLQYLDSTLPVEIHSAVGYDIEGDYIIHSTGSEHTNISHVLKHNYAHTSSAVIIVDKSEGKRTSIVYWGACTEMQHFYHSGAEWCHFIYLDRMKHLLPNDLRKMVEGGAILSADLCLSHYEKEERDRLLHLLTYFDYMFVSDVEATSLTGLSGSEAAQALGKVVRRWAIVHHPVGSYSSNGDDCFAVNCAPDQNVGDVLGAGDAFAAAMIYSGITRQPVRSMVKFSHESATNYLRRNQRS